ncbi:hypothetical protein [Algoriphagus sp.]|uniref:hypothetical protein n=1 Tax=Algoriphagus sp. TaxID=1872435 RepID=UPI0025F4398A|nr:hypothetical protein [Algoriphagus sp.]
MKRTSFLLSFILIFLTSSCWWLNPKYSEGYFPSDVTNFESLNTSYNDYNMDIRILFHEMDILFSSDRNSKGATHYDLVGNKVVFSWDQEEGIFTESAINGGSQAKSLAESTISIFNERGPYTFGEPEKGSFLLFSRDDQGYFTIHAKAFQIPYNVSTTQEIFEGEESFRILSERGNELYPSFYGENFEKVNNLGSRNKAEKLILSSDQDGKYDIYEIEIPDGVEIMDFLRNGELKSGIKLPFNSSGNDHAPFVSKSRMVFASDRPGGYGGYDLYYSDFKSGKWSEPQNFGPDINTEFDEFRPIIDPAPYFKNSVMIFSSNRPDGLGGFDLYYVGIPKY